MTMPLVRKVISGPTMGTRYSAVLYAPEGTDLADLQQALQAAVNTVDAQMSTWKPDSDLMQLNRAPLGTWFQLPIELYTVLASALEIGRLSEGMFNIGVGDLVAAWGFGSAQAAPDRHRIAAAAGFIRRPAHLCLDLDLEYRRVRKRVEITLDLSGIAKGFGVDELARALTTHGIDHFLVSIDGELSASGGKPDGSPWRVAVEKPQAGLREAEGVIELTDGAIATSGDYRHFVDLGGVRYAHIMDPYRNSALPAGRGSVTVVADTCMAADAWAKALLLMGPVLGGEIAGRHGLEALFVQPQPDERAAAGG